MRIGAGCVAAAAMVAAAVSIFPGVAPGEWPSDPAVNVAICTAPNEQFEPQIVADGAGGAIIAWQDVRRGTINIYAQHVDARGVVQWSVDGEVICSEPDGQTNPRIASDGAGGAIIVWEDWRTPDVDIYAQKIDASGSIDWSPEGVAVCRRVGLQDRPRIVSDDAGGAIIVWQDQRLSDTDIYAQRVDAAGNALWTEDGEMICAEYGAQWFPEIVTDRSGGAIIAWEDQRLSDSDIYAQRVSGSGTLLWSPDGVRVCDKPDAQEDQQIVADNLGGAVVAWVDHNPLTPGIDVQNVDAWGNLQWGTGGVRVYDESPVLDYIRIASDGSGGGIVTWIEYGNGSSCDIHAQRVDVLGAPRWGPEGAAVCVTPEDQLLQEITEDASGGAVLSWVNHRTAQCDIYAQRVDSSGHLLCPEVGVPICTAAGVQYFPELVCDGSGGAIITWQDARTGLAADVYAQKVNWDCSLGEPSLEVELVTGGGWILREVPDPKSRITFGFNVHSVEGRVWGQLQLIDHKTKMKVHSEEILTLVACGKAQAEFSGTCRVDRISGYTFKCLVEDNGEPGHGIDRFSIELSDVYGNSCYSAADYLGGGNIQIHKSENGSTVSEAQVHWQNYPNPFRSSTAIGLEFLSARHVAVDIYDLTGKLVRRLVCNAEMERTRTVVWDGKDDSGMDLPSGIYIYRISTGAFSRQGKMIMAR